jgi:hypothetical protein
MRIKPQRSDDLAQMWGHLNCTPDIFPPQHLRVWRGKIDGQLAHNPRDLVCHILFHMIISITN